MVADAVATGMPHPSLKLGCVSVYIRPYFCGLAGTWVTSRVRCVRAFVERHREEDSGRDGDVERLHGAGAWDAHHRIALGSDSFPEALAFVAHDEDHGA